MKNLTYLLALFAISLLCSCGSVDPAVDYGGNTFPKSGTTYTYHYHAVDSTGATVPGSDTDWTATVISDNANYMGKEKVFQVDDNGTKNYYTYEHNGDVDLYLDPTAFGAASIVNSPSYFARWYTFPTVSHTMGVTVLDTTLTVTLPNFPLPVGINIKGTIGYVSEETITVGSESFKAQKCEFKVSAIALGSVTVFSYIQDISFVSKIGYLAKSTTNTTFVGGSPSGDFRVLTSYALK